MKNHIIFFSGGKSSFTVAHLVKERYPDDNILLYFTDTMWEDEDLYRFIYEASDKLKLPMLTHSMGINPIELMYEQKVLFNSRIGNCSKILKMKVAADFLKKGKVPNIEKWHNKQFLKSDDFVSGATLYFGIGWDEMHREGAIKKNWQPFTVEMPLIEEIIDNEEILRLYGIRRPRLYDYGFTHNNCKGRCVKAGQGHFTNLAEKLPSVFEELMEQEHHLKNFVSSYHFIKNLDEHGFDDDVKQLYFDDLNKCYEDYFYGRAEKPKVFVPPNLHMKKYAFMKKQKDNQRFPYQLRDLAKDVSVGSKDVDKYDIGGCGCFVEYESDSDSDTSAPICEINLKEKLQKRQEAETIKTLNIDIETYSSNDLKKCGVYKYVEAEDFEILIFAYSVDGQPTQTVELALGEEIPPEIIEAILNEKVLKKAWNAQFERICISEHIRRYYVIEELAYGFTELGYLDPKQWRCTMVDSTRAGLPATLKQAAIALKLDVLKDEAGTALINYFSKPRKPTKTRPETRNLPHHDMEKWNAFVSYCRQDVEVEKAIGAVIEEYVYVDSKSDRFELMLYQLDQNINDRGILLYRR